MMNEGWRADCAFCVGSKFTCDEHHFLHQDHTPQALAVVAELGIELSSHMAENLLYAFDEGRKFALAAGAQSAETNEDLARSEGRQSGAESATPNPSPVSRR